MKTKDIYMYVLGAIIVLAFFATIYILATIEMPAANEKLLYIVIGALVAKFSDVVAYFFGSSKGSADKTEIMAYQNSQVKTDDK